MILSYFIPRGNDFDFLNNDMNQLTEQALKGDITFSGYMREYANYMSELDSGNIMYNATSFIFLVIYFVIVPIFTKCTIGKYIMKIKIEHKDKKKVGILNTFIRSIIDIGLLYSLITVFLVQIVNPKTYLIILIIFGIIQFLLVIISAFMVLYRSDKRSLSDILSKTNVVLKEVKE
jgi:uncharacterized RDD family membrane protein YckC